MESATKTNGRGGAKVCVVGAGPAGLATIRALSRRGIRFDCFERHRDVGGIWDQDNPGSPIYDSTHFISSRAMSGFHGYPMPEELPDYPGHSAVLDYLRAFAGDYGLSRQVTTGTAVELAEPRPQGGWRVTLAGGEQRSYEALVCANGTTWDPSLPDLEGEFDGEMIHSSEYRSPTQLAGRRVLVLGAGNSGVDIACDAAQAAEVAWISMRRGYHVVPKHVFGIPADVFAEGGPELPMPIAQRVLPLIMRTQVGRPERYGLPKPDHKLFESHPILNSQIFQYLSHGDLAVRPGIERLDGAEVVFTDGRRERPDLIVLATGYRFSIPYLAEQDLLRWAGGRPQLFMHLLAERDDLYGIGFTEGDGGAYGLFDEMADLVALAIAETAAEPAGEGAARLAALRRGPSPDVSGGVRHIASDRHAAYLHLPAYRRQAGRLREALGWGAFDPGPLQLDAWRAREPARRSASATGHPRPGSGPT